MQQLTLQWLKHIGRLIKEFVEMKNGNKTAEYGKQLIKELSKKLSNEYGK